MAWTLNIGSSVTATSGVDKDPFTPAAISITAVGADVNSYTVTVTDAGWTALSKGNIGSLGLCILHNLSETDGDIVYVSRNDGTTEHGEIPPKGWVIDWLRSSYDITTMKLKAATGKTVSLKVKLFEA